MKRSAILLPAILSIFVAGCSILASPAATAPSADGVQAEWAFTQAKQQPERLLIGVIDGAKTSLDIAIYSLTKPDIVDAIKRAKKRGVAVRLITDRIQSSGKTQAEALKLLGSAGIPMKQNKHAGLMHLKVTIADGKVATTGSFNYSKNASTDNDEVLIVLRNRDVAQSFASEFEAMWKDDAAFKTITPVIGEGEGSAVDTDGEESDNTPTTGTGDGTAAGKGAGSGTGSTGAKPATGKAYSSCAAAKADGHAPLRKGDPGYSAKLDGDGDGVACER